MSEREVKPKIVSLKQKWRKKRKMLQVNETAISIDLAGDHDLAGCVAKNNILITLLAMSYFSIHHLKIGIFLTQYQNVRD